SSGVNTLSGSFPKSHSSQYSELGVTRTPLSVDHSPDSGLVSTPLPSSRFQFVPWHRLEQCEVTGDQLTCPRELNLSYQNLGDPYQRENFFRILRRLIRVEILQLIDNSLTDLSSVRLPRCKMLNLHRNHLVCLRQLPKLPAVEHLCLSENAISSLRGLGALESSPLRSLNLTRNPVTFSRDYRAHVFFCLPNLEVLDGIPKLPGDSLPLRVKGPESSRMPAGAWMRVYVLARSSWLLFLPLFFLLSSPVCQTLVLGLLKLILSLVVGVILRIDLTGHAALQRRIKSPLLPLLQHLLSLRLERFLSHLDLPALVVPLGLQAPLFLLLLLWLPSLSAQRVLIRLLFLPLLLLLHLLIMRLVQVLLQLLRLSCLSHLLLCQLPLPLSLSLSVLIPLRQAGLGHSRVGIDLRLGVGLLLFLIIQLKGKQQEDN
ncbi:hypothetical protein CCH79_00003670, partial [Gambusia affinis]